MAERPQLVMDPGPFTCTQCSEDKPGEEFYWSWNTRDSRWQRDSRCRFCHNGRNRTNTPAKVINRRARQRATALLLVEYADRFAELLAQERRVAENEYYLFEEAIPDGERQVLRPGRRRAGQEVIERLDVARCTDCQAIHDAGHVCPKCGGSMTVPVAAAAEPEINWSNVATLVKHGTCPIATADERAEAVLNLAKRGMTQDSIARWLRVDRGWVATLIEADAS